MKELYLSNEIFDWDARVDTFQWLNEELWKRAYEIWGHAQKLIENKMTKFDLSDGILNLKRSFDQRLKLIESIYSLKNIEYKNKPKGYLELLGEYKIIRPFIMKKLLDIRNNIEHNDAEPPDENNCKEWLDIIWYFLKSTDAIVQTKRIRIWLDRDKDMTYSYSIDLKNHKYPFVEIMGLFPNELISKSGKKNYFKLHVERIERRKESESGTSNNGIDKSKTYIGKWLLGKSRLDGDIYRYVTEKFFSAY